VAAEAVRVDELQDGDLFLRLCRIAYRCRSRCADCAGIANCEHTVTYFRVAGAARNTSLFCFHGVEIVSPFVGYRIRIFKIGLV